MPDRFRRPVDGLVPSARDVRIRDFAPADVDACLDVFQTNVPEYFVDAERAEYLAFLNDLPGPYVVLEQADRIVACGGHAVRRDEAVADLCWGMVHFDLHGRGLGRRLTRARIERASAEADVETIALNTSQHTEGFYRGFGFETVEIVSDGYAPGLHRHEMRLKVS